MADLGKSQAQWNAFFKVLGAEVQVMQILKSYWARAAKLRSGSVIQQDQQGLYTSIDLAGQAIVGENTDANGFLYGEFTLAGTVTEIFKDSARTMLVASGTTAPSTTTTLTEQNSSGFTGIVVVRSAVVGVDDADWQIEISQDMKRIINDAYSNILDESEDDAETISKGRLIANTVPALVSVFTGRRTNFGTDIITSFIADFLEVTPTNRAVGTGFKGIYDTTSVVGQRLLTGRTGILASLNEAMQDQSAPAGPQSVQQGTTGSGNLVPKSTNLGSLKNEGVAASTSIQLILSQHVRPGVLHLKCTDQTVGQAKFSVENVLGTKLLAAPVVQSRNDSIVAEANARAQVAMQFQDQPTGLDFKLFHVDAIESSDTGNIFTLVDYTSLNATETDFGKIYGKVVRTKTNPPDASDEFVLSFYSNSARTSQIGSQTIVGIAGTTPIVVTTSRGMVITGTFSNVNADVQLPVIDDEIATVQWDKEAPRLGDEWTVSLTNTLTSPFIKWLSENYCGSVPTSGTPTIADGYAKFTPTLEG